MPVYRPAQIEMRKEMLKVKGSGSGWNDITMILIGITYIILTKYCR